MRIDNFDVQSLIDYLQGTCKTIDEGLHDVTDGIMEEDDMTAAEIQQLDEEIFRCEQCGWWCEMSDQSEDPELCTECNPEEE